MWVNLNAVQVSFTLVVSTLLYSTLTELLTHADYCYKSSRFQVFSLLQSRTTVILTGKTYVLQISCFLINLQERHGWSNSFSTFLCFVSKQLKIKNK